MNRYAQRRDVTGTTAFGAAGWLFAELAMVLLVVVFGSETPAPVHQPPVTRPAASTTNRPAPTGSGGAPVGLSLSTAKFTMAVPADGSGALDSFRRLLDATVGPNAQVGLILLFGVSRTSNALDGTAVSGQLRDLIRSADIPQLRSTADVRSYLGDSSDGPRGSVKVELFLLNGPS